MKFIMFVVLSPYYLVSSVNRKPEESKWPLVQVMTGGLSRRDTDANIITTIVSSHFTLWEGRFEEGALSPHIDDRTRVHQLDATKRDSVLYRVDMDAVHKKEDDRPRVGLGPGWTTKPPPNGTQWGT
jgi:hypothetical protein